MKKLQGKKFVLLLKIYRNKLGNSHHCNFTFEVIAIVIEGLIWLIIFYIIGYEAWLTVCWLY